MNPPYTIWPFDCVDTMLHLMDPGSVHCVVTSPPYYGLRDYGMKGQIGLEETPDEYVARIVEVARAIRRVLREDGTFWLNLGDSYARTGGTDRNVSPTARTGNTRNSMRQIADRTQKAPAGLKEKDLIGIPWRVAFALQADGWYLRQEIIWHKENPMPESVRDRCTKAHEQIFLLTKSPRYFYDADAIAEPFKTDPKENYEGRARITGRGDQGAAAARGNDRGKSGGFPAPRGRRNKRSVWTVNARPFKGAHFATFPPDLIEPCILAGSPTSVCARCGAPRVPDMRRTPMIIDRSQRTHGRGRSRSSGTMIAPATAHLVGFKATCRCGVGVVPAVVFDPFGGSGTTALVAIRNGRHAVLCELNPEYVEMAHLRIAGGK